MSNKIYIYILIIVSLAGCKPANDATQYAATATGIRYQTLMVSDTITATKPKYGDVVEFYLRYGTDDTILFDGYKNAQTVHKQITRPAFATSFEAGLPLLGIGDSAVFVCNADSVFGILLNQPRPNTIAAGSDVKFWIKMVNIRDETAEINDYITEQNITAKPDPTGLTITDIQKSSGGGFAAANDSVWLHYTAQLLNGTEVETTRSGAPLRAIVGAGTMLEALEIATNRLPQGTKARLICPSYLCYAAKRQGNILPFTPLILDIEIIKIIKNK